MKYFSRANLLGLVFLTTFGADYALADDLALEPQKHRFVAELREHIDSHKEQFFAGHEAPKDSVAVQNGADSTPWQNLMYLPIVPQRAHVSFEL